ncbi:uncharacterized protein LOC133457445 [Cololabis saira]|uniref:uncharacterized protein LOC133457445 n=1 Tax=Cololabis saira TaxID=129043 RepID=UPI002AD49B75|nr:uncharacterized protein LOC133457445 [Cololabis saira]
MSADPPPDVAGYGAAIMKNVWEIRTRESWERRQLEDERRERSALDIINKDWADRIYAKMGAPKKVAKKPKPSELELDDNLWKGKVPATPRTAPVRKSEIKASATPLPPPPPATVQKVQVKRPNRLQLLMSIAETQPSAAVWSKAWKYKSSPPPEEGSCTDWGQCWMFRTSQPHSEPGTPFPEEPNMADPETLHLWRKPDSIKVEPQELDWTLPGEDWQASCDRSDIIKGWDKSEDGGTSAEDGLFTALVETQRRNEVLSSSEWMDSWRSTKPEREPDPFPALSDGSTEVQKQDEASERTSQWEDSWRSVNHHGRKDSKVQAARQEWAGSWRAATKANLKTPHQHEEKELQHHEIVSPRTPHKDLHLQLDGFELDSDWNKSWQVIKNNSKPSQEIDKVLKALPPLTEMVSDPQEVGEPPKVEYSEKADPYYEQLRHDVIFQGRRQLSNSKVLLLEDLLKVSPLPEWKDSWKLIKHRKRVERRRFRPDPMEPFKEGEMGVFLEGSWKCTYQPLNQTPELWEQDWSTFQRHRDKSPEFPTNGPTDEQIWGESWKFSVPQHQSEPEQGTAAEGRGHSWSLLDWQDSWMVSETQFHHDKPSLSQWRNAWRRSVHHTPDKGGDESAVIQQPKKILSLEGARAKMSRSFDDAMFREQYPEREWRSSWSAEPLLKPKSSRSEPGTIDNNQSDLAQRQQALANERGCKWGMSFRIANPMPHLEGPWTESCPNPVRYPPIWSRHKETRANLSKSDADLRFWANSHLLLRGSGPQKTGRRSHGDPRVILTKKPKTRKHLLSNIVKEQKSDKKWAGCHLLAKTQPRSKKGGGSATKPMIEKEPEDKLFEDWGESWKFLVHPESLKKSVKSLSGWGDSWKFLLPPY